MAPRPREYGHVGEPVPGVGEPGSAGRSRQLIERLVGAAIAAPSLHNTQPWRFRIRDGGLVIAVLADPARMLPEADPQGRAAHIACGAAVFNLRVAAAVAGVRTVVRLLPAPGQALLLAEVALSGAWQPTPWECELDAAIPQRQTNREPYSSRPVPPGIRAEMAGAATAEDAVLHFLDLDEARRVRRLAADAERALLACPEYLAELTRWVGGPRTGDGIPDSALGPGSPEGGEPVRQFLPGRAPAPARWAWFEEHPQLAVLSAPAGGPRNWLAAGQALERVWLTATARGISCCPLTQPLESTDAWQVRGPWTGESQPQMILRIGYGLPFPAAAPRRPLSEVIDWPQTAQALPRDHQPEDQRHG